MKVDKDEIYAQLKRIGGSPSKDTLLHRHCFVYYTPSYANGDLIDLILKAELRYNLIVNQISIVEFTAKQDMLVSHPMLLNDEMMEGMVLDFIKECEQVYNEKSREYEGYIPFDFSISTFDLSELKKVIFRFIGN